MKSISIRVPASTANLGPGFDTLGVALNLYNTVTLSPTKKIEHDHFMQEMFDLFFKKAKQKTSPFDVKISGDVPRSRGLGSSVTVRLGILYALNEWYGRPLKPEQVLDLTIELEQHPDNAVPAFYGGFVASNGKTHIRVPVQSKLHFVAAIPSFELETKKARAVLPKALSRADVVTNIQNAAVIVGAFASKKYELLQGALEDKLHQPYRAKLIPGFNGTLRAAERAGALAAFLSGAGPTLMALTLQKPEIIASVMLRELKKAGDSQATAKILKADNQGVLLKK